MGKSAEVFRGALSKVWPSSVAEVVVYARELVDGGARKSTLEGFRSALVFLERGGGRPIQEALHGNPEIKASFDELALIATQGVTKERRQAPQYTVSVLAAMQHGVLDNQLQPYKRMTRWWKLVKIWGLAQV